MNTASSSGLGPLPSNTIANPKGELKAITTRSGLFLDGPSVPMPPPFINSEEDERAEETLTDPELAEDVQGKQQFKDEIQIHQFWQMFKQLHINITLADALILIWKYQKMVKAFISNKEKLLELVNTPLNENCSAIILKKLPEKLGDTGKFLILCGFSELKCKALADLGASINLMPLSVWKKLGLPELISTRMTLELANWAICTPAGIARDVFILVGKFTFLDEFVIVDYESIPRVPLILGRPFLRTARALIDVHGEEMILRDGDERLTLNMRHDTSSYSNQPHKESINMINIYNDSYEDYLKDLFATNHLSGNPTFSSHIDLTSPEVINPLSGNTTYSSPDHLLEEFVDELALITFPPGNDDLSFDIESDFREIEYLLNHDPTKEMDYILEDLVDEVNLADPNKNLVDTILEMFTDEHTLDYSSPPLYDDVDVDLVELESDNDDVYDDPFDSKEDKIKVSQLLMDDLDPPRSSNFLPSLTPDKNVKKISISNASLILEDFNPPLYDLPFHKEVFGSETLLSFSSENEEKNFNPGILTSKGVHTSLLLELSYRGPKAFKVIKIFKSPVEIFPCSYGEDIRILDVTDIQKKDKNEAKTDKTEHGMEKREKSKSTKSKSTKVKVKDGAETEEMLNGPTHLVSKFINELFPPSRTTNLRNEISNFQQRFDESFHEAWDRYKDLLRACPHHGFTELHQLDTIYNALNPADQDSLNSVAGGNLLERRTQDVLTIIENKSKVRNFQNKSIVSQVKSSDANSSSSSEIAKLTHAVNQQTSVVTTAMTVCLAADGNTFLEFWDNIQGYVSAATVNYNHGNFGYHPKIMANQNRPLGFAQPNVQNNQNRFSQPQGYNRGNNFNQDTSYQAQIQQNQVVPLSELEKNKKINEINTKAMQTQINNVKNELRNEMKTSIQASMSNQTNELKNMMASFFQMNTASSSGSGPLPSNTIANPKEEHERAEETLTDPELADELKCKALADLGASINLMPLSVWKKLGRPFLRTARALIDVHEEEMILHDGDERLTLNMRHDTSSYSNQPHKESINMINIYNDSYEDYLEDFFATNHLSGNPTFSSHTDLTSLEVINPLSGNTTYSSPGHLLKENRILLNHDPTKEMDSILEDSIDEGNLADPNNNLVDTIPEMFTDEHTLDYSSPPLYDDVDDDLVELESDNDDVYDDPFDSKEDKIKESKLLIDEHDPPRSSDFLFSHEYDSILYANFSEVDALPLTDNEDTVFNSGILIHENLFEVIVQEAPDKNVKKISISNASLILEDFNPPLYDLPFHKEVLGSETLLSFSSENEEKVFILGILTSEGVHTSLLPELSHRGPKAFKVIKNFESPMEIFPCSYGEDICILNVSCLHLCPS
uniref:Retrotransposon gag domain-containing protein n=1 Tax=Tanacetum cinerariifolium TaxID=118510 RepID=A0A6L2JPY8_TANCI|nr:hypothetical protein [Tanacetum cinerariifolium]